MEPKRRLLVVDDEPSARLIIQRVLERAGYEVIAFETGEEAIYYAQRNPVDLLMVDRNLPKMSGAEVIGAVRKTFPKLPVILMTAGVDTHLPGHRVDAFLAKPFTHLRAVEEAVREAFDRSGS